MILLAAALAITLAPASGSDPIVERTRRFLDAYAANRVDAVVKLLDPSGVAVYGSDAAEFCETSACVTKMMADDFALWRSASFGDMTKVTVRRNADLASIYFEVPFSAGGGPSVPVRISLTWRRVAGAWKVSQSSNVVPTRGSGAR